MAPDEKKPEEMAETPPASPAEEQTPEEELSLDLGDTEENQASSEEGADSGVSTEGEEEKDEDSVLKAEWERLKGSTQDRIRQLIRERNELRKQLEGGQKTQPLSQVAPPPPPSAGTEIQPEELTEEQRQAFKILKEKFGVVTKEDLQALQDRMALDNEHTRLERLYDGSDGRPKYDRVEVEDWMRRHPGVYVPEVAYKMMYEEELADWHLRQAGRTKRTTYSERPKGSTATRRRPLTVASLRERLNRPDGREWWEKNRERILPLMGELLGAK